MSAEPSTDGRDHNGGNEAEDVWSGQVDGVSAEEAPVAVKVSTPSTVIAEGGAAQQSDPHDEEGATGYFTSDPAASEQTQYHHALSITPSPSPSVSASDVSATGLIESSDALSPLQVPERPVPHSTVSSQSIRSVDSAATVTAATFKPSLTSTSQPRPAFPNQSYAALHNQVHPSPHPPPPLLKQRSSHPGQIHTFTSAFASRVHPTHQSGSKTVGNNSPAVTPGPGLFSYQPSLPLPSEYDPPATPGTYASPFLHFMQRVPPKETHVADVDVDPVSGRKLINHYEIIDELGRGTHGKVKLGRDLDNGGSYVAIKIVERFSRRRKLGKLGTTEDKVKKEVAILKQARHPHVVALLEVIDDPSRKKVYIVLEWVERGEIQWRTKGPREIAMVEARRYEREKGGTKDSRLEVEDMAVQAEAMRRLEKQKRQLHRSLRRMRREATNDEAAWSVELAGDDMSELSDDDKLSRISTESHSTKPLFDVLRRGSRAPSPLPPHGEEPTSPTMARAQQYLPLTSEPQTLSPTTSRIDFGDYSLTGLEGTMYGAYVETSREPSRVGSANGSIHSMRMRPQSKSSSEYQTSLAADILDNIDLNPELEYVPLMTMQQTRVAFRDTLLGLQYLHYQGIVHRDIKPPNLLATKDHRVKISDFGVSYLGRPIHEGEPGEDVSEHETQDLFDESKELAKTVGTPAFYAPELCIVEPLDDPPPITKAIDVWALGVTLFCMLFARTPYVDNEFVVMRQIADEEVYIPRKRLRPVDAKPRSRPSSHGRAFPAQPSGLRHELDLSYEEINDDLYDLLKRLLTKDPLKRIKLEEVRHHPWVVADIQDRVAWLEETDPNRQNQGKKIEVSKEDVNSAVVPLQFLDRVRSQIKRVGERLGIGSSSGRARAHSNTGSRDGGSPTTSISSSSTAAAREGWSHSLRGDEQIISALRASREGEHHPLSRSVAASPELQEKGGPYFDETTARLDSGAGNVEQMEHSTPSRQSPLERATTVTATAGSMRTLRQSDFQESPPPSPGISPTTLVPESPGGLVNSGRSVWRDLIRSVRDRSTGRPRDVRTPSSDRASTPPVDMHAEASIASSQTNVSGHMNAAFEELLLPSLPSSVQHSPVASRPVSLASSPSGDRLSPSMAEERLSRVSSAASVSSIGRRAVLQRNSLVLSPDKSQSRGPPESSKAEWKRAEDEHIRKLVREQEEEEESQPSSPFDNRICPPSPDDQQQRKSVPRRLSEADTSAAESSHGTSPTTQSSQLPPPMVSSTSDFGSAVSVSISNPSIPSVISEASSVDPRDLLHQSSEYEEKTDLMSSDDTVNERPLYREEMTDDGYTADDNNFVLNSDDDNDEYYDDSSDSDGGLVMSRRKSAAKPSAGSKAAAQERRLSARSKKSSRSGSSNTMKKIRSRGSDEEHQRPPAEIDDS